MNVLRPPSAGSVTSEDAAAAATVFWVGVTLSGERRSCEAGAAGAVGVTLSGERRSCDAAATWTRAFPDRHSTSAAVSMTGEDFMVHLRAGVCRAAVAMAIIRSAG